MLALLVILAISTSLAIEFALHLVNERADEDAARQRSIRRREGEDERRMNDALSGVSASRT